MAGFRKIKGVVILSEAKDLSIPLRVNSAKDLGILLRVNSAKVRGIRGVGPVQRSFVVPTKSVGTPQDDGAGRFSGI